MNVLIELLVKFSAFVVSVHGAVRKVTQLEAGQSVSSEPLLGKVHIQALICKLFQE